MKINILNQCLLHALNFAPVTIARFGPARLVKHFEGPYELVGGTAADRAAAQDWCALFAPEVVIAGKPANH